MNKNVKKIMFSIIFSLVFIISSLNHGIATKIQKENTDCYGFILPLFECENETVENQINCRIKHLINDLLREQIPVYWASTNFTALVSKINFENESEMDFEKGSFIIPFTGDDYNDTKILVMIYDYNMSSEIEENKTKIPVYLMSDSLSLNVYPLVEVKIAQCLTPQSTSLSYHVEKAGKCGFLDYTYLKSNEIADKLNNSVFNVVIWGAVPSSNLLFQALNHLIYDLKYKISNPVRNFVSKGGGYVGSCYGAYIASYGTLPIPVFFIRRAYNPNLKSIGYFAISDVLTRIVFQTIGQTKTIVVDDTHPVTFGLEYLPEKDHVLYDVHINGPKFVNVGKNSQIIAKFYDTSKTLDGSPMWISSRFGKGKIIIFSGHPEMLDSDDRTAYFEMDDSIGNGKKIISNSYFYSTCEDLTDFNTVQSRNSLFMNNIWCQTSDLSDDLNDTENIFYNLIGKINETQNILSGLNNDTYQMLDLIEEIAIDNNIDLEMDYNYLGNLAANYLSYDLGLFEEYMNDLKTILKMIEHLYSLNSDKPGVIDEIEELKNELSRNINKTKKLLLQSEKTSKSCIEELLKYKKDKSFPQLKENKIKQLVRDNYHNCENGFLYIPTSYFNSLKTLRKQWYNYETEITGLEP